MTLQVSTGFTDRILGEESFKQIFDSGAVKFFSGSQPATANAPEQGALLGLVTTGGAFWSHDFTLDGVTFEKQGQYITKSAFATWILTVSASGVAGWFRIVGPVEDDGGPSYTLPRIDGAIGVSGNVELIIPDLSLTLGYAHIIDSFAFTIPPIVGL